GTIVSTSANTSAGARYEPLPWSWVIITTKPIGVNRIAVIIELVIAVSVFRRPAAHPNAAARTTITIDATMTRDPSSSTRSCQYTAMPDTSAIAKAMFETFSSTGPHWTAWSG